MRKWPVIQENHEFRGFMIKPENGTFKVYLNGQIVLDDRKFKSVSDAEWYITNALDALEALTM